MCKEEKSTVDLSKIINTIQHEKDKRAANIANAIAEVEAVRMQGERKTEERKTMSENGSYSAPRKVVQFKYIPKFDVTIYELALLIPVFTGALMHGDVISIIEGLPDEAKRHFEEIVNG